MVMERRSGLLDRTGLNQQVVAEAFSKMPPTFSVKGREFFCILSGGKLEH